MHIGCGLTSGLGGPSGSKGTLGPPREEPQTRACYRNVWDVVRTCFYRARDPSLCVTSQRARALGGTSGWPCTHSLSWRGSLGPHGLALCIAHCSH